MTSLTTPHRPVSNSTIYCHSRRILVHCSFTSAFFDAFVGYVFFLMIRPPPRSPLFPSPTLSRSQNITRRHFFRQGSHALGWGALTSLLAADRARGANVSSAPSASSAVKSPHFPAEDAEGAERSEEHTSELQSLAYLVCRLLLEKK